MVQKEILFLIYLKTHIYSNIGNDEIDLNKFDRNLKIYSKQLKDLFFYYIL